jgi:hypothetical protein
MAFPFVGPWIARVREAFRSRPDVDSVCIADAGPLEWYEQHLIPALRARKYKTDLRRATFTGVPHACNEWKLVLYVFLY